jgi:lysophospholipase L1-like esterase
MKREFALLGFAAEPNITVDDTSINAMGFTGDVLFTEKKPETIRILTLGGSTLFNRQMTERLIKHFRSKSDKKIEVLGAGLRTHTSMSSVLKYRILSKYNFDYVLIYHGINDLFVNHVEKEFFNDDFSHMLPWYKRNVILDKSLVARVVYNNFIWGRKLFGNKKTWYIYPNDSNKNLENEMSFISEKLFRRNITTLIKEVRKDQGVPVLMTFAWTIPENYTRDAFIKNTVGYNKSIHYHSYPVELWGSVEYVLEGIMKHNNVLKELSRQYDTFLIDQEIEMGKDLIWFEDICHFSVEGAEKFAKNVAEYFIMNNIL